MKTYQSLSKSESSFSSTSKLKTSKEDEFSVTPLQQEHTETNSLPESQNTPKITFNAIRDNINRSLEQESQTQEEKETAEKEPELGLIAANPGIIQPKPTIEFLAPRRDIPFSLEMGQSQPSIMTKMIQRMTNSPQEISTGNSLFAQRVFRVQDPSVTTIQADFEQKLSSARGGGSPLDHAFRARVEPAMGADFSGVKVHTDSEADRLSQSIQAKAFTTGNDIFFRKGEYQPGSNGGQELLAHELTHVVQQTGSVQRKPEQKDVALYGEVSNIQEDDSKPWYGDLQDFGTGFWEGGKDTVTGLASMGKGAWNLTGGWLFNPEESKSTWNNLSSTTKAVVNDPTLIWEGIKQPYVEDWNSGHHAKALGRGTFDVLSILAGTKGLDKLSKASKLEKIASVADKVGDTAKIADKVGDTAKIADKAGDTAKITDKIDDATQITKEIMDDLPGTYSTKIKWGIHQIEARPIKGKGFWGKRITQSDPRIEAFELKINPNNESFYVPHPEGGYVQFENFKAPSILEDGKLVKTAKSSIYRVYDKPEFLRKKILDEAKRQITAANSKGLSVEWLVSDEKAVEQLTRFFQEENVNITVKFLAE